MGMFDWVDFKMRCPRCGEEVDGFQSKDGPLTLALVNVGTQRATEDHYTCEVGDEFTIENYYASCDECGTWIEFYGEHFMLCNPSLHEPAAKRRDDGRIKRWDRDWKAHDARAERVRGRFR